MSDAVDLTKFRNRIAEKRAKVETQPSPEDLFDADLVPDLEGTNTPPNSDPELDRIIDGIGIIDAYRKWCGKSSPSTSDARQEGIKVSCPVPSHPDRDPSAWLNTDKNVWFCGSCELGGDAYDIAAYHFGYPVPGYKTGAAFHELRQKMAEAYGYVFVKAPGMTKPVLVAPEPEPEDSQEPEPTPSSARVIPILGDPEAQQELPSLDWRSVVASGTFLDEYMNACIKDDAPEEYHFWNGLLALGMAVGRDVTLFDQKPVMGNLFICLLGPTGDGKSRSFHHLQNLLWQALPYKYDDPNSKGTAFINSPASAEVLIHSFMKPVEDPANPKIIAYYAPVRGLIEFNEMSSLVGRASRKGNVLKPTLMEFYDGSSTIATSSMATGTKKAERAFGSCFTTTQPKALRDLLRDSDAHSGFLNRWIFATGTPKRRVAIGGAQIDTSKAVDPLQKVQGWAGLGRNIQWTDTAAEMFTDYFHEILHPAQLADDTGLLTRMDLLAKKLCLLLSVNSHDDAVTAKTVERVTSMFAYLTGAYGIPAAHIGSTISTDVTEELEKHIRRYSDKKGGISLNELRKCIKRKNFPIELVSKCLKYMTELGYIEVYTTTGVGRPTVKYRMCA